MTTKAEFISQFKTQYPTLKTGDEENGYTDLDAAEYEATISAWADNLLAKEAEAVLEAKAASDKAALLKRLGLTADEATLLLS
jgi:hypothetical protein